MPPTYHRRYPGPVTKRGGRALPVPRPTCLARFVAGTRGFSCAASPRHVPCVAVPRPNSPGTPSPSKHKDRSGNVSHTLATTKTNKKRTKTYLSLWQHSDGKIPKNLGLCGFRFWPNAPRVVFWFVVGDPCVVLLCNAQE